jgi:hypothetical protein
MSHERKQVNVCGETLHVEWNGNVWLSPSTGRQHARASDAISDEITEFFSASGEDMHDPEVIARIAECVSRLRDRDGNGIDCDNTQTCQCCGGALPARDIWEANRNHADDCTGAADADGRCHAFSRDELWQVDSDEDE